MEKLPRERQKAPLIINPDRDKRLLHVVVTRER
jgi:hypothetical protein